MKKFLFLFFVCLSHVIYSQNKACVGSKLFKINILTPGFSLEKGISDEFTVCLDANLSLGFGVKNNGISLLASPLLRGQYRYFYNLQKRFDKGKDISGNSGSFLALHSSYYFSPLKNEEFISSLDGFTLGSVWGFEKTYKGNLNIVLNTGIGYNLSNNQTYKLVPILNFTISWVLVK